VAVPAKVSFDFDGVLSRLEVQQFARELLGAGLDVWIVTMRFATRDDLVRYHDDPDVVWEGNDDLYAVASGLGISKQKIVFTNWEWKSAAIREQGFVWHLDDCPETLRHIRAHCRHTRAFRYGASRWKDRCEKAIAAAASRPSGRRSPS
jgi:hypothetical protein